MFGTIVLSESLLIAASVTLILVALHFRHNEETERVYGY